MSRYHLLLLLVFTIFGFHLYRNVLPYHLSSQKPLVNDELDGRYINGLAQGEFHGNVAYNSFIPEPARFAQVLGESTGNKRIEVDLTNQRVYAFEGDRKVYDFLVSTGKWGKTPTGTFNIWIKLRYTKMEGGNRALNTYYYLPNVPFVMYFANSEIPTWRGFGLHGTYWHSNFGHPMSHGCINLKTDDAEKLYYWATPTIPEGKNMVRSSPENPGTPIIIYGTAPLE